VVQRFQCPSSGETTYLELTEQLYEGSMSARLAEFSAYYSNRMSYDEVAGSWSASQGSLCSVTRRFSTWS
jgi:hypothetical protein